MKTRNLIGKYVYIKCSCGDHLIDLFDFKPDETDTGFYTCNTCNRPLICRGVDGNFYFIGEKLSDRAVGETPSAFSIAISG